MAIAERTNKDSSQSFRARVRDPGGKWYRSEWRRHRDEAVTDEGELLGKRRKGEAEPAQLEEGKKYTWNDFWEVFAACDRTETSPGWKISQDQMERDYVRPVLGKKLMSDIGSPQVGRVLSRMSEMGRGPQMRLHVYRLMNQVFDRAVNYYGMIKVNPVNAKYHRVKVVETESQFLEPAQSWALFELAKAEDERAVCVELLAGLRTEATLALTWPCILWDTDQILIRRAFKQKIRKIEDWPKGKKWEYVPLPPALKAYLWGCYQRAADKEGFVCPGPKGGMLAPETYGIRLKKLCRKAGVPAVSPHILRHSCTEIFVDAGASQEDLRRLLNHKNGSTTLKYMHRTDDRLSSIAARIRKPKLRLVSGGARKCTHGSTHVGTFQRTQKKKAVSKIV